MNIAIETINNEIQLAKKDPKFSAGAISDGYHTFDELYEHRIELFIALLAMIRAVEIASGKAPYTIWKSRKHSDGSEMEGWFIMGIGELPGTQISYHLPNRYWDDVHFVMERKMAPEWDGHTASDVIQRFRKLNA